jgi:hypothetical protein
MFSLRLDLTDCRGQRNADGLKYFAADSLALGPYRKLFSIFFDRYRLKRLEILFNFCPFEAIAGDIKTAIEFLS